MAEIFDFKQYFRKKYPLQSFGLTDQEVHVCLVCLHVLKKVEETVSIDYFDPEAPLEMLLKGDRKKFEQLFSTIISQLDLFQTLSIEEIPVNREFETFPTMVDLIEFMIEKTI